VKTMGYLGKAGNRAATEIFAFGWVPAAIIMGIAFLVGGVVMYTLGIVSAVIYLLAAVGLISVFNMTLYKLLPTAFKLILSAVLLIVFPLVGYASDHMPGLQMLSFSSALSGTTALSLYGQSWEGEVAKFFVRNTQLFGGILLGVGVMSAVFLALSKRKKNKSKKH
jgi:hypothetical protein